VLPALAYLTLCRSVQALALTVWVPVFESSQAACAYSWISPPSRSRRTILAGGAKATGTPGLE